MKKLLNAKHSRANCVKSKLLYAYIQTMFNKSERSLSLNNPHIANGHNLQSNS